MKRLFLFVLVLFAAVVLVGCGEKKTYEVAVVTDVGQLKDGGFNQGTYEGAVAFCEATGKTYKYYQPGGESTDDDRVAAMRLAIENGAKIIVTPGFLQQPAIEVVAKEYPEVKFVFVDGWNFGLENVTAICYKEQESGFFAGYAAVKDGYEKLGGTFGGDGTNAACNRFAYGYVQGAQAAAAEMGKTVEIKLSFQYGSSFAASPELKTQIGGWYASGTEVVFSCGGSMLQSVKAAAAENPGAKIIGVDVDQAGESEAVITSAVKGLKVSVEKVLNEWNEGKWNELLADKLSNLGAAEDATGLPTAESSWRFAKFTVEEYNTLFAAVKAGTIKIDANTPASMKSAEVWATINDNCPNVTIKYE